MNRSTPGVSPLRQRMLEDMHLRKLEPKKETCYVRAVRKLAAYLGQSPDTATAEDLRLFQLYLVDQGTSPITLNATLTGLKFFFGVTLGRGEVMAKTSSVRVPQTLGGWRFGNTIDGSQAEYLLVPDAMTNLAAVPDELSDEQVLMCPDIMSTGLSGAERANIRIGDTVAVFAQGPIGLCAAAGAKLSGATTVIGVDRLANRLEIARRMGADHVIDSSQNDPVEEIMRLTAGRGVDVAIEALGTQATFEACLRALRPGGTLSARVKVVVASVTQLSAEYVERCRAC